jgi:hypothetical protein
VFLQLSFSIRGLKHRYAGATAQSGLDVEVVVVSAPGSTPAARLNNTKEWAMADLEERHTRASGYFTSLKRCNPVVLFLYNDDVGPLGFHEIGYFHRSSHPRTVEIFNLQRYIALHVLTWFSCFGTIHCGRHCVFDIWQYKMCVAGFLGACIIAVVPSLLFVCLI